MTEPISVNIAIEDQVIDITVPSPPTVSVTATPGQPLSVIAVEGPPGPQGPTGQPGPAFNGTAWWYGNGPPPASIVGAKVGDFYLDTTNGEIYELE